MRTIYINFTLYQCHVPTFLETPLSRYNVEPFVDNYYLCNKLGISRRRGEMGKKWLYGLVVSALVSRLGGLGLSPDHGHCIMFLGKILYSYHAPV